MTSHRDDVLMINNVRILHLQWSRVTYEVHPIATFLVQIVTQLSLTKIGYIMPLGI